MSRLIALAALMVVVAASGCQTMGRGCGTGEPCHITRSNMAPRPEILRTTCSNLPPCGDGQGCFDGGGCGYGGCGCDTGCCDGGCCDGGYCDSGYCDAGCGYEGCGCDGGYGCDGGCGCEVGCCDVCGGGGCASCGGTGWCGLCNRFCCNGCGSCEQCMVSGCVDGFCGSCASGDHRYNFNPGPPAPQTTYPYYTVRGPRDFLIRNPSPLGPY